MPYDYPPAVRTYKDADGNQQSSLAFNFNYFSEPVRNVSALGLTHTGVCLEIDTRSISGAKIPPPFRSLVFRAFFLKTTQVRAQGELIVFCPDTNFYVTIQPQFSGNADTVYYSASGIIPIEMAPGGKVQFIKLSNYNTTTGQQNMDGFIQCSLSTKQLPAFVSGGVNLDQA